MEKTEEKLENALLKVALGYQIAEVTEEYAEVDGAFKLTKRKKTKKDIPPDLKAVQMLLCPDGGREYSAMSDEELEVEKARLLETLKAEEKEKSNANGGGMAKTNAKKPAAKRRTVKKSVVKKKEGR